MGCLTWNRVNYSAPDREEVLYLAYGASHRTISESSFRLSRLATASLDKLRDLAAMAVPSLASTMALSDSFTDQVLLSGINFEAEVGLDLWHREGKTQPVQLDVQLTPIGGLEAASQEDNVAYTIDYGKLYKALKSAVFNGKFESVTLLYLAIRTSLPETVAWTLVVTLPKAILEADGGLQLTWNGRIEAGDLPLVDHSLTLRDIHCRCIIGINTHEKLEKQRLSINVTMSGIENRLSPSIMAGVDTNPRPTLVYQDLAKEITEVSSARRTVINECLPCPASRRVIVRNNRSTCFRDCPDSHCRPRLRQCTRDHHQTWRRRWSRQLWRHHRQDEIIL